MLGHTGGPRVVLRNHSDAFWGPYEMLRLVTYMQGKTAVLLLCPQSCALRARILLSAGTGVHPSQVPLQLRLPLSLSPHLI